MKKFLNNIEHTKLGRILDHLFVGSIMYNIPLLSKIRFASIIYSQQLEPHIASDNIQISTLSSSNGNFEISQGITVSSDEMWS